MIFSFFRRYMLDPILFSVGDPVMASLVPIWYGNNILTIDKERVDRALFDPGYSFSDLNRYLLHNIRCNPDFFIFHGGVLEKDGNAYVFLANSRTGKSTLMAYLSQKGWTYINDDYVIISQVSRNVVPDSYPLHLRIGGIDYLNREKVNINIDCYIPYQYSRNAVTDKGKYIVASAYSKTQELPIKGFFFLDRSQEYAKKHRLTKESVNDALKSLLTASFHAYSLRAEIISFMILLADKCYSLCYTNASDVLSLLKEFDDERS